MYYLRTNLRRRLGAIALASIMVILTTSCSSSGSGSARSESTDSTSSSNGSVVNALVHRSLRPTTKINQTTPLKSKPPTGKTIAFVGGNLPSNLAIRHGIEAAAESIGWHVRNVPGYHENDPSTLINALDTALSMDPVAVVMTAALPESVWKSELPKYAAAGVALVPLYSGKLSPPTSTMLANIGSPHDVAAMGRTVGQWIAFDAAKSNKRILMFNIPAFPITGAVDAAMKAALTKYCPSCTVTEVDGTLAELTAGTITQPITSALQRGEYDYVFSPLGEVTKNLPSELGTAGIDGVKIASVGCDAINESHVLAGTEAACVGYPYVISGWISVDTVLRALEGMSIPASDGGFPRPLLLMKQNSSSWKPGVSIDMPSNYSALYRSLWKVG